jgi:hypothetical protein
LAQDAEATDDVAWTLQLEKEEFTFADGPKVCMSARLPEVDLIDFRLSRKIVEPIEISVGRPKPYHHTPPNLSRRNLPSGAAKGKADDLDRRTLT